MALPPIFSENHFYTIIWTQLYNPVHMVLSGQHWSFNNSNGLYEVQKSADRFWMLTSVWWSSGLLGFAVQVSVTDLRAAALGYIIANDFVGFESANCIGCYGLYQSPGRKIGLISAGSLSFFYPFSSYRFNRT